MKQFFLVLAVAVSACLAPAEQKQPPPKGADAPAARAPQTLDAARLLEDVRTLADDAMEGRATGTAGGAKARAFVLQRFKEAGLKPLFGESLEQKFAVSGPAREGVNVVGYVRGKSHPERMIFVTAHYDHIGVAGPANRLCRAAGDDKICNGADDNASGVAALFAMAAHFAREQPENTIVFAALDAEEIRLLGAKALVRQLVAEKREVALNVNLDMVSHSERGELYAAGTYHYPQLRPHLEKVAAGAPVKLLLGHDRPEMGHNDWTNQSDHAAFHAQKIPFVYFGVEDHKDYHRPSDGFDTITKEFYVRAAETILAVVREFDAHLAEFHKPGAG